VSEIRSMSGMSYQLLAWKVMCLLGALLVAACSGPRLPFEKDLPTSSAMVTPPWETLVKAGPGADKELDLETLNGPGGQLAGSPAITPPPVAAVEEASPQVDSRQEALNNPDKPVKKGVVIKSVAVPQVEGAAGTGNADLTVAMRQVLREAGWPVVNAPAPDAITIRGKVSMASPSGASQTIKLQWVVSSPDGKRLGDIAQSNDVETGSLNRGWGENARFASEAAAEGIFKLIQGYR
jgi:hypothetical protein